MTISSKMSSYHIFWLEKLFQIQNIVSNLSSSWVMHSILAIKANQKYTFRLFDTL